MARRRLTSEDALYEQALSYLDRFETSSARLARYLRRKIGEAVEAGDAPAGAAGAWTQRVIDRLIRVGLVDDARYAERRAGALVRRGKATRVVRQDLRMRGLSDEHTTLAIEALAEEYADPDLSAAMALARRRRLGPWYRGDDRAERRAKHRAALGRAGFSFDVARRVVEAESPEALTE